MNSRIGIVLLALSLLGCRGKNDNQDKLVTKKPARIVPSGSKPLSDAGVIRTASVDAAMTRAQRDVDASTELPKLELAPLTPDKVGERYELAVSAVAKQPLRALALLQQMHQLGCAPCIRRLEQARDDKRFSPLWSDGRFVAMTVSKTGPFSNISWFSVQQSPAAGPKPPANSLRAYVVIDHRPGYVRAPEMSLRVRTASKTVATTKVDTAKLGGTQLQQDVVFNKPGWYHVDLMANGKLAGSSYVAVGNPRCAADKNGLSIHDNAQPRVLSHPMAPEYQGLNLPYWQNRDVGAEVVEWRHNGALVPEDQLSSGDAPPQTTNDVAKGCRFGFSDGKVAIPRKLASGTSGTFEGRVYRNGQPGIRVIVRSNRGKLRVTTSPIPVPAAIQARLAEINLRYLAANDVTNPPAPPPPPYAEPRVSYRGTARTSGYPSLSPDGMLLAVRHTLELKERAEFCRPPTAEQSQFIIVPPQRSDEMHLVGSRSLEGYLPLRCGVTKLPGGATIKKVQIDNDWEYKILDSKGNQLGNYKSTGGFSPPEVCAPTRLRIAVFKERGQLGGDCGSHAELSWTPIRY